MDLSEHNKIKLELYREDVEALVHTTDTKIAILESILSHGNIAGVREMLERNLLVKTYLMIQLATQAPSPKTRG